MPKSQLQVVGFPVDWSWKFTTIGEQSATVLALKFAEGVCPKATTYRIKARAVNKVDLLVNFDKC